MRALWPLFLVIAGCDQLFGIHPVPLRADGAAVDPGGSADGAAPDDLVAWAPPDLTGATLLTQFGPLTTNGLSASAKGQFDTDNDCKPTAALGSCKTQMVPGPFCVCRADDVVIAGDLQVTGTAGLAILAAHTVQVKGVLSAAASGSVGGPGAGGGGACGVDCAGGTNGAVGGGSEPPSIRSSASLVPLLGGQSGQPALGGGGGGGAIEIAAGQEIVVLAGVDASGGGGLGGGIVRLNAAGRGGGSGGSILLESPLVDVEGVLVANGGGGGGGGGAFHNGAGQLVSSLYGLSGQDGQRCVGCSATGGKGGDGLGCFGQKSTGGQGGQGGAGAPPTWIGQSGQVAYDAGSCLGDVFVGVGGGGGGAGRIRINALTATGLANTSPMATLGGLTWQ
jgi:hypothetical protein